MVREQAQVDFATAFNGAVVLSKTRVDFVNRDSLTALRTKYEPCKNEHNMWKETRKEDDGEDEADGEGHGQIQPLRKSHMSPW